MVIYIWNNEYVMILFHEYFSYAIWIESWVLRNSFKVFQFQMIDIFRIRYNKQLVPNVAFQYSSSTRSLLLLWFKKNIQRVCCKSKWYWWEEQRSKLLKLVGKNQIFKIEIASTLRGQKTSISTFEWVSLSHPNKRLSILCLFNDKIG